MLLLIMKLPYSESLPIQLCILIMIHPFPHIQSIHVRYTLNEMYIHFIWNRKMGKLASILKYQIYVMYFFLRILKAARVGIKALVST